jgi:hypothetical protein
MFVERKESRLSKNLFVTPVIKKYTNKILINIQAFEAFMIVNCAADWLHVMMFSLNEREIILNLNAILNVQVSLTANIF